LIVLLLSNVAVIQVPEGESLFKSYCSPCHTIGRGRLIGPDLANVQNRRNYDWLRHFIRSSQSVIQSGDEVAIELFNANGRVLMPDQTWLSDQQIEGIIAYISSISQKNIVTIEAPSTTAGKLTITAPSNAEKEENYQVNLGRALFSGLLKFSAGGPACITCHNVTDDILTTGARFAPDLTNIYSRITENEIVSYATNPIYTSMQKAYKDKPITIDEAQHLVTFFKYAATDSEYQKKQNQQATEFMDRMKKEDSEFNFIQKNDVPVKPDK